MKSITPMRIPASLLVCLAATFLVGCASDSTKSDRAPGETSAVKTSTRFKADDGRIVDIGRSSRSEGGLAYKEPHMDKCWVADGFTFTGYDTLYIAPTVSTAKLHNDAEQAPQQLAKENLPIELERMLRARGIFQNIVLRESDIKPGAKVLKMENTILEYAKGGGAARFFAGVYGAGQPVIRIQGTMSDADKPVFRYEARRSGVSAGARLSGGYLRDEDIQVEDIRSLSLDLADFMSAVSGRFQPK